MPWVLDHFVWNVTVVYGRPFNLRDILFELLDRDSTCRVEIIGEKERNYCNYLNLLQKTRSSFWGTNVHAEIRLTNFALDPCCSSLVHLNYCWRYWSWEFSLVLVNCVFILFLLADDYLSFLASLHKWKLNSSYLSNSLILWIAYHFFLWEITGNRLEIEVIKWHGLVECFMCIFFLSRAVQFCAWLSLWKLPVNGSTKCLWFINAGPQYCIPFLKSDVTIPVAR